MRVTMLTETYDLIVNDFIVEDRRAQVVKGFGETELFYLEGEKERTTIRREFRL